MKDFKTDKDHETIRDVLQDFKRGKLSLDEVERLLKIQSIKEIENVANLDVFRENRVGIPEIILAEGKSLQDLLSIVQHFLDAKGMAILSRVTAEQISALKDRFSGDYDVDIRDRGRIVVIKVPGPVTAGSNGFIGVVTAGTSDIVIAEEAAAICEVMGCKVKRVYDVGIAGIHRIFNPLADLIRADVDVIICCAGMEGALPTVVASLTDVIVIGVPVSTGYGFGGKGETALRSMLQSCAPGLVVVNIDNGVGAGAAAVLIARRIAILKNKMKKMIGDS
ncbi:MAG: nickel pincer cofactor biosynthesis protein LarB [Promethearchaeota archaeon]